MVRRPSVGTHVDLSLDFGFRSVEQSDDLQTRLKGLRLGLDALERRVKAG
jgi:hypothetical protein